jgi:hypothetical protein
MKKVVFMNFLLKKVWLSGKIASVLFFNGKNKMINHLKTSIQMVPVVECLVFG